MNVNTKYTLGEYGGEPHLFVILEDGHNVLNADAVNFGLRREFKQRLSRILKDLVRAINTDGMMVLKHFSKKGIVKRIEKQESVKNLNVWEVREDGHGGRIFFLIVDSDIVVVSATDKTKFSQDRAINRGVRRWKTLLKN